MIWAYGFRGISILQTGEGIVEFMVEFMLEGAQGKIPHMTTRQIWQTKLGLVLRPSDPLPPVRPHLLLAL